MMVATTEARERRGEGTGDIKGAHLHAEKDDFTAVKFTNDQVDAIVSINLQCKNHSTVEGKNKLLHLMLSEALHGTVRDAILWHTLLTETLIDLGFKLNPCDFCVANATIEEKQCANVHHVDGTKASHMGKAVVRQVCDALESKFGSMKAEIGKEQDFLWSTMACRDDRRFETRMASHLSD